MNELNRARKVLGKRIHVYGSKAPAIVDEDEFIFVSSYSWHLSTEGYVLRNEPRQKRRTGESRSSKTLAECVVQCNDHTKERIVYLNGDKLDCRKVNLAVVSVSEAGGTAKLSKKNTSGFKGVSWSRLCKKWGASITVNGKRITLGYFTEKMDAVYSYDAASVKYFGETAMTNKRMGLY